MIITFTEPRRVVRRNETTEKGLIIETLIEVVPLVHPSVHGMIEWIVWPGTSDQEEFPDIFAALEKYPLLGISHQAAQKLVMLANDHHFHRGCPQVYSRHQYHNSDRSIEFAIATYVWRTPMPKAKPTQNNEEMVEWTVKIRIANIWIEDGFRLDLESLQEAIDEHLLAGCTTEGEIEVETVQEPTAKEIDAAIKRHESMSKY